ncbi:type II secretion system protein E, partial [mine drainage metagenome]
RVYIVDDSVTPAEMDALMGAYVQGLASAGGTSMKDTKLQHAMIGPDKLPPDCGIEGVRLARGGCYPVSRGGKFMTLRLMHEEGPGGRQVTDHLGMRLRVPPKPTGGMGLTSLGYFPDQIALIDQALEVDTGIIVVGGPTGSGKSTMLWETLVRLRKRWPYRRVVTAENPPERNVPGAVQLEIGGDEIEVEEQTAAFREAMRMMLRMAPHVILVGEIREGPIGRLAIEMSTAGHL